MGLQHMNFGKYNAAHHMDDGIVNYNLCSVFLSEHGGLPQKKLENIEKEKWEHIEMMEKVELRFTKRVKIHFL